MRNCYTSVQYNYKLRPGSNSIFSVQSHKVYVKKRNYCIRGKGSFSFIWYFLGQTKYVRLYCIKKPKGGGENITGYWWESFLLYKYFFFVEHLFYIYEFFWRLSSKVTISMQSRVSAFIIMNIYFFRINYFEI